MSSLNGIEQSNFDLIRKVISPECITCKEVKNEMLDLLGIFMDLAKQSYVIVQWPESQMWMEEEWFEEEAILDVEGKFGSSAYFVPLVRML
jgi:hypothetical protein